MILRLLTKRAGSGSGSESGSVSPWYGSADPYPYKNVTDPEPGDVQTFRSELYVGECRPAQAGSSSLSQLLPVTWPPVGKVALQIIMIVVEEMW
jgi:hypothetical protein